MVLEKTKSRKIKKLIEAQFSEPEEGFVKFITSSVYDGIQTPKVKQQFSELTKKALTQFLSDSINDRLKNAHYKRTVLTNTNTNYG